MLCSLFDSFDLPEYLTEEGLTSWKYALIPDREYPVVREFPLSSNIIQNVLSRVIS